MIARLISLIVLSTLSLCAATIRYVAPSGGSDSNPGTYAQPFATAAPAVALTQAGDTIVFMNGTHTLPAVGVSPAPIPFVDLVSKNGSSSLPITIKGESYRGAKLQGAGNLGALVSGETRRKALIRARNCSWLIIEWLNVEDCDTAGIWLDGSNDSIVRSNVVRRMNWVRGYGAPAIAFGGSYTFNTSERNLAEDNIILQYNRHGIALQHGYGNRNTIRGNYFNDLGWRGNGDPNSPYREAEAIVCYGTEENLIENNIAHNVFGHAVSIHGSNRGSGNRVLGCIGINGANQTFFANSREATSPARAFITNAWFENCVAITNLQSSGFGLQHGSNIVVTNCVSVRNLRGYYVTQNDFFWYTNVTHSDIWDANLQFKPYSAYLNNSVALNNTSAGIEFGWENTVTAARYEGMHRLWMTNMTSDGHGANNYVEEASAYTTLMANVGYSTTNPGYDTATYGNGAYLMRVPGDATRGAEVLYRYHNGVLTATPLWPWKMEAAVAAETDYSVTWEDDGAGNTRGLWKTLAGVYSATDPDVQVTVDAPNPYAVEYPTVSQTFVFSREDTTDEVVVHFVISGTGVSGTHYVAFSDQVTFAVGESTVTATVEPIVHGEGIPVTVIVTLSDDPEDPDTYVPSGGPATITILPRAMTGSGFRPPPGQRSFRSWP